MAIGATTTPVQANDVVLEISTDNGSTYKKLVCLIKQGVEKTRSLNETETQCGVIPGLGPAKTTIPFEGAVNVIAVDEASTYVSYSDLLTIFEAGNAFKVRQKHPSADGAIFNFSGSCYLTELKLDQPVGNICTFSGSLSLF